jgi:hypothetical protein
MPNCIVLAWIQPHALAMNATVDIDAFDALGQKLSPANRAARDPPTLPCFRDRNPAGMGKSGGIDRWMEQGLAGEPNARTFFADRNRCGSDCSRREREAVNRTAKHGLVRITLAIQRGANSRMSAQLFQRQRVEQLLVDPTESAVRHHQHHVALVEARSKILHDRVRILQVLRLFS